MITNIAAPATSVARLNALDGQVPRRDCTALNSRNVVRSDGVAVVDVPNAASRDWSLNGRSWRESVQPRASGRRGGPLDDDRPASSRVIQHWLDSHHTFAPDRRVADQVAAAIPGVVDAVRLAHRFRRSVLHHAVGAGITQVLDLGAGVPLDTGDVLPASSNGRPVRIAYIDHDPLAVQLHREVCAGRPAAVAIEADLAFPGGLLDELAEGGTFTPADPALVLLSLTMDHLVDFVGLGLLSVLHRRLAPGSRLMVSALVADPLTADHRDDLHRIAGLSLVLRNAAQTQRLMTTSGWDPRSVHRAGLFAALARRQPAPELEPAP